jgi:hypothetical protein
MDAGSSSPQPPLQPVLVAAAHNPEPGRCNFFLPGNKRRWCRFHVCPGKRYCGNHLAADLDGAAAAAAPTRVPCPVDPSHSVAVDQLDRHVKICNATRRQAAVQVRTCAKLPRGATWQSQHPASLYCSPNGHRGGAAMAWMRTLGAATKLKAQQEQPPHIAHHTLAPFQLALQPGAQPWRVLWAGSASCSWWNDCVQPINRCAQATRTSSFGSLVHSLQSIVLCCSHAQECGGSPPPLVELPQPTCVRVDSVQQHPSVSNPKHARQNVSIISE